MMTYKELAKKYNIDEETVIKMKRWKQMVSKFLSDYYTSEVLDELGVKKECHNCIHLFTDYIYLPELEDEWEVLACDKNHFIFVDTDDDVEKCKDRKEEGEQ